MKKLLLFLLTTIALYCRAQTGSGNTVVIKVRAPKEDCSVYTETDHFWVEKENVIRVVSRKKSQRVFLEVTGGKIIAHDGENYTVRFTNPMLTVLTVYQYGPKGKEIVLTKKMRVTGPSLYFCGIKVDSFSRSLSLRGMHLYAYSECFKTVFPVYSFEMYFTEDTINVRNAKPVKFKSDTCLLTAEMRQKMLRYQPKYNYICFHNIFYVPPDGKTRLLDPVRLHADYDTTSKENLRLVYELHRINDL